MTLALPETAPLPPPLFEARETRTPVVVPFARAETPVARAVSRARDFALRAQRPDGHWCAELESNTTITAEYVFMRLALGLDLQARREKLTRYFFGQQKTDGSWGLASNYPGDVSTTVETYLALRILGVAVSDERLQDAERYILVSGGIAKVRVFTRIFLAMFGLFPWSAVPSLPPEFILLPATSPVNVYTFSSWARGTIVPLLLIFHHQPVFALPDGRASESDWLDHLWLDPTDKAVPYRAPLSRVARESGPSWATFFTAMDDLLHTYGRFVGRTQGRLGELRKRAVARCTEWVLERQEANGDWAGIFPPMLNTVLALFLGGYSQSEGPLARGLEAIERFSVDDAAGFRVEPCQSPLWDTVLMMRALTDARSHEPSLARARDWVERLQILCEYGDWRVYNPEGRPGGFSFEYTNTWYPDVDDTAAVVLALVLHDPTSRQSDSVLRSVDWMVSMQNDDGGWAAFDKHNDKEFLNEIPFSDMDSLCDPSSPDIAGRVLEALGVLGHPKYAHACLRGIEYIRRSQEPEGSWFGRWGVNYVYGTSNVLAGLARQRLRADDPTVARAITWLRSVQNADGGWGECLESYASRALMGKGRSTPSQTAWALIGLLPFLPREDRAIGRGVQWLLDRQTADGTWNEEEFTGTGFPKHFYLRYNYYRHYFPMMALARFARRDST